MELEVSDIKEYEVETIWDNAVYAMESDSHLPRFYYLMFQKSYLKEKNIQKLSSAIQHLQKLINSFYKDHAKKPTVISLSIDSILPMLRPTVRPTKPIIKQNETKQLIASANKLRRIELISGSTCFLAQEPYHINFSSSSFPYSVRRFFISIDPFVLFY